MSKQRYEDIIDEVESKCIDFTSEAQTYQQIRRWAKKALKKACKDKNHDRIMILTTLLKFKPGSYIEFSNHPVSSLKIINHTPVVDYCNEQLGKLDD